MAIDFSFPTWALPKETPWDALLKGAQVGNMIAQNRFRNQQLYATIQQQGVENDLRERKFMADSEAQQLQNQIANTRLTNDAEDFKTAQTVATQVSTAKTPEELAAIPDQPFHSDVRNYHQSQIIANKALMLGRTADGQAKTALDSDYALAVKDDPMAFVELNQYDRYSQEWATALKARTDALNEKKQKEAIALRSAAAQVRAGAGHEIDYDSAAFVNAVENGTPVGDAFDMFPLTRTSLVSQALKGKSRDFGQVTGTGALNFYSKEISRLEKEATTDKTPEAAYKNEKGEWDKNTGGKAAWDERQKIRQNRQDEIGRLKKKAQTLLEGGSNSSATVRMKAPDGSIADVPAENVEAAKKMGATVVE